MEEVKTRNNDIDLTKMVLVRREESGQISRKKLRITKDGMMCMSSSLCREIKEKSMDMTLTFYRDEDYKRIVLVNEVDQNKGYKFRRDGKTRNMDYMTGLIEQGYQIPAEYILEWSEENGWWLGILQEIKDVANPKELVKNAVSNNMMKRKSKNNVRV